MRCFSQIHRAVALVFIVVLLSGCDKNNDNPVVPVSSRSKTLFVLNSLGRTISAIDLATGKVTLKVATVGDAPNQIADNNGRLYVVNSLDNNVQVFNDTTFAVVGTVDVGSGTNPMMIAFGTSNAYVTCLLTNEVKVIDLQTLTVKKSISCGRGTTGIVVAGTKAYATNTNLIISGNTVSYGPGSVTVINTLTGTVVDSVAVPTNPQGAELGPDGNVHVVCTGDYDPSHGWVAVINPSTDAVVKTIATGGSPTSIVFSPAGVGYLGSGSWTGIMSYDGRSYAIVDSSTHMLLGRGGSAVAAVEDGSVYVADFASDQVVKLTSSKGVGAVYAVGDGPQSFAARR